MHPAHPVAGEMSTPTCIPPLKPHHIRQVTQPRRPRSSIGHEHSSSSHRASGRERDKAHASLASNLSSGPPQSHHLCCQHSYAPSARAPHIAYSETHAAAGRPEQKSRALRPRRAEPAPGPEVWRTAVPRPKVCVGPGLNRNITSLPCGLGTRPPGRGRPRQLEGKVIRNSQSPRACHFGRFVIVWQDINILR